MVRRLVTVLLVVSATGWQLAAAGPTTASGYASQRPVAEPLMGRIVATAIPGAAGISSVGVFHPGGPIRDKPEFAAYTEPQRVLDPTRILVTSSSNFGAPMAMPDQPAGSILSLDVGGAGVMVVPADFARSGGQAAALDGRVQLYTAQSPTFVNGLNNPEAVTASLPTVSQPLAISINNAFGRPWFANAPNGWRGAGTESIVDPNGLPLAGAPSKQAGGVFAGDQAGRQPQPLAPGALTSAAIGTALLGASPDGGGRAVFVVVNADGSLIQAHAERGVDGLAPPGTIRPLTQDASGSALAATRAGVVFNWVPNPILYVADPLASAIVVLTLGKDGQIFSTDGVHRFDDAGLDLPVDIAPAVPEVASPAFSSNTTLAGGSDLYVANRGNGTITRLRQDGEVVAIRQVGLPDNGPIGADQLNGIAVSPDAQRIWVTLSGNADGIAEGTVVELPSFGG